MSNQLIVFSMLFSTVMKGLEKFYTTGDIIPSACGRLPTATTVHVSIDLRSLIIECKIFD